MDASPLTGHYLDKLVAYLSQQYFVFIPACFFSVRFPAAVHAASPLLPYQQLTPMLTTMNWSVTAWLPLGGLGSLHVNSFTIKLVASRIARLR